jgi:hypothetical protein
VYKKTLKVDGPSGRVVFLLFVFLSLRLGVFMVVSRMFLARLTYNPIRSRRFAFVYPYVPTFRKLPLGRMFGFLAFWLLAFLASQVGLLHSPILLVLQTRRSHWL